MILGEKCLMRNWHVTWDFPTLLYIYIYNYIIKCNSVYLQIINIISYHYLIHFKSKIENIIQWFIWCTPNIWYDMSLLCPYPFLPIFSSHILSTLILWCSQNVPYMFVIYGLFHYESPLFELSKWLRGISFAKIALGPHLFEYPEAHVALVKTNMYYTQIGYIKGPL